MENKGKARGTMHESGRQVILFSWCTAVFLAYTLFLSICDVVNLIPFYLGLNKHLSLFIVVSFLVSAVIVFFSCKFIRSNYSIKHYKLDPTAITVIVLFVIIAVLRSIIPDTSHDTSYGRVYWQTPGYYDNTDHNVFPAGFTFCYPLGDRMFYYPRMILGFRFGTLYNLFLLVTCFLQLRIVIHQFAGSQIKVLTDKRRDIIVYLLSESSLAFIGTALYYSFLDLGTYMVDLCSLPVLLVLIPITFQKIKGARVFPFAFYALLCGFCIAMKIPNVIFVAPLLIVFLCNNHQKITLKVFIVSLLVGISPFIAYAIYTYTSTGNPIFWTFNSLFKSPFISSVEDFKDMRWGPDSLVSGLLWPLHVVFRYDQRVSEINAYPQVYLLLGTVAALILIFRFLFSDKQKWQPAVLALVYLLSMYLWVFSTGYPRYGIICEIVAVIVVELCLLQILERGRLSMVITYTTVALLLLQVSVNTVTGLNNVNDWSWRGKTLENLKNGRIAKNLSYVLNDRNRISTDEEYAVDDFLISTTVDTALARLYEPTAEIINIVYVMDWMSSLEEETGINFISRYKDKINGLIEEGKTAHGVTFVTNITSACDNANRWGFQIDDIDYIPSYFEAPTLPMLLEYKVSDTQNTFQELGTQAITDVIRRETRNGKGSLNGFVYASPYLNYPTVIDITVDKVMDPDETYQIMAEPGTVYNLREELSLDSIVPEDKITIVSENSVAYAVNLWIE